MVQWLALGQLIVVSRLLRLPFFQSDQQCCEGRPSFFSVPQDHTIRESCAKFVRMLVDVEGTCVKFILQKVCESRPEVHPLKAPSRGTERVAV
ncbi:unnamed protein product [Rodentolepis nana]|uniref:Secreted protein n=1 Tax=Rodentolepis nana TaxID=102285 RepID=A0A0R3TTQ5_RODNA|nr:unnamed protein product [Rodentolepis nana]